MLTTTTNKYSIFIFKSVISINHSSKYKSIQAWEGIFNNILNLANIGVYNSINAEFQQK